MKNWLMIKIEIFGDGHYKCLPNVNVSEHSSSKNEHFNTAYGPFFYAESLCILKICFSFAKKQSFDSNKTCVLLLKIIHFQKRLQEK